MVREMSCRDARPLLALWFDDELDPRLMRQVTLHTARCSSCLDELESLRRGQELVAEYVRREVESADLGQVWRAVSARLPDAPSPRYRRWADLGLFREEQRWRLPALAAAAIVLLALTFAWSGGSQQTEMQVADRRAVLDAVETRVDALALLGQPENHTLVLWVADKEPAALDAR